MQAIARARSALKRAELSLKAAERNRRLVAEHLPKKYRKDHAVFRVNAAYAKRIRNEKQAELDRAIKAKRKHEMKIDDLRKLWNELGLLQKHIEAKKNQIANLRKQKKSTKKAIAEKLVLQRKHRQLFSKWEWLLI